MRTKSQNRMKAKFRYEIMGMILISRNLLDNILYLQLVEVTGRLK